MPWRERTRMSERQEFVVWAQKGAVSVSALCQRFGISRKTGYKWLRRYREQGLPGLAERSRRPRSSPRRTTPGLEARVVALRQQYPAWGGRRACRLHLRHRRSLASSAAMDFSTRSAGSYGNCSVLKRPSRMCSGRWTSRGRCGPSASAAIRSRCWTITPASTCAWPPARTNARRRCASS